MSKHRFEPLSPRDVEERFAEAARTLRRLPEERPIGYFNVWPAIVRTRWEIMAMEPQPMKVLATPQAITRMELCMDWMLWLDPEDARLVWLRAEGHSFRYLARHFGVSRMMVWRRWAAALIEISNRTKTRELPARRDGKRKAKAALGAPEPRQSVE